MSMRDLIEKLKEQPKPVGEHREEQKEEWLDALEKFFTEIEGWLAPAVTDGVLTTARSETEILEQDFGDYQVPVLEIRSGGLTVRLEPIGVRVVGVVAAGGRRLLGLRGRVDLVCGPIRVPFVRGAAGAWKAIPLRGEPRDVTEESFSELLGEVLL